MILTITSDPGASIARKGFTLICARRHFRERYKIHRERRERRGPPLFTSAAGCCARWWPHVANASNVWVRRLSSIRWRRRVPPSAVNDPPATLFWGRRRRAKRREEKGDEFNKREKKNERQLPERRGRLPAHDLAGGGNVRHSCSGENERAIITAAKSGRKVEGWARLARALATRTKIG